MRQRVATSLGVAMSAALPLALATVPFVLACRPSTTHSSGDSLGTYAVQGTLVENGCGLALEAPSTVEFRVELSRNGTSLTWRMPGAPPVPGSLTAEGVLQLRTSTPVELWPADPENGIVGCTVSRIETIDGTMSLSGAPRDAAAQDDAGASMGDAGVRSVASFEATSRTEIVPVVGTVCSPALLVNGGNFPTLPCTVRYELVAAVD